MAQIISSICGLLIVIIICVFTAHACSNANDRYYKAQMECVTQGGSWISVGSSGSYQANCVYGRGK